MKFVLLICVLIPSCIGWTWVNTRVSGTLTCPTAPFMYGVLFLEEDGNWITDDYIDETAYKTSQDYEYTVKYEVKGSAIDPELFFDDGVEPYVVIYHTCETEFGCICKKWENIKEDMDVTLDVELARTDLNRCEQCDVVKFYLDAKEKFKNVKDAIGNLIGGNDKRR